MAFNFSNFLLPWVVCAAVLILSIGINLETINELMKGLSVSVEKGIIFSVHTIIFLIFLSIFLIPSVKNNMNKIINKIFEFPLKIVENFFKA